MIDRSRKIDKNTVHKTHDDDVLLYDMRHVLAAWLPLSVLQQAKDNPDVLQALDKAYRIEADRLVLRGLPSRIDEEQLEGTGLLEQLGDVYEQSPGGFRLTGQWVLEHLQSQLSSLTGEATMPGMCARQHLHERLKTLTDYPQGGPLYFTMFNDTSNYFFYRKHHEHVPGMMLIEVARQAMYAEFYAHSGFARGEVSISILDLTSRFSRFTESSYPVDLVVSDRSEPMGHKPRKIDKRTQLFQNGMQVAEICLYAEVIKMPVFKRMRNISIDPAHWFRPLKGIRKEVLVRLAGDRHMTGEITLLSMSGLRIKCASQPGDQAQAVTGHVYLYLENDGLVTLPVAAIAAIDAQEPTLHLEFGELNSPLRFSWREVLKQFTYFSHSEAAPSGPGVAYCAKYVDPSRPQA